MGSKIEAAKTIGKGLLALGSLPVFGWAAGLPSALEKEVAETGFDDSGELDFGYRQYVPFFNKKKATERAEKKRLREGYKIPGFADILSVAGQEGVPKYTQDQDPLEFLMQNRVAAEPLLLDRELARDAKRDQAAYMNPALVDERRIRDQNMATSNRLLGAKIDAMTTAANDSRNQFNLQFKRLEQQDRRDYEERTDRLSLQNQIAQNSNRLSMAQLGIQKQDQANQMTMWNQQLADAKESRNLALIGAALDGLSMTFRGLRG